MTRTIAFTSAAQNYLPKVRKLFASLREHHPEFELVLALADEPHASVDFASEPLDRVIAIGDLDIPDKRRWTYFHSIVELSTAIKPYVLETLLGTPPLATTHDTRYARSFATSYLPWASP